MKKIIRQATFETNSSSTHAICICNDKKLLEEIEYPEYLYFGIGEHGWEFEVLDTPEKKANYLYTAILELYDKKEASKKVNIIFEWLGDIGVVAKFEEKIYDKYGSLNGYIDHVEGLQDFVDAIFRSPKLLYKYLFSDYSYVQKGNDNSYYDVDINEDYDHKEFYKWN